MDGVEELIGVTVIGATNRPEVLVSGFRQAPAAMLSHLDTHFNTRVRIRR